MTIDDAVLIDYALGTVSTAQAREVESFLRAHPEAAKRVRRMQDDLARLVMSLPPESVDGGAEEGLVGRLRRNPLPPLPHDRLRGETARRSSRWASLGIAAALGLAAWLILGPLLRSDPLPETLERYQSQPGALSSRLITEEGQELGTLVRLRDGRLFVAFDERPVEGIYQLWEVNDGVARPLAVVEGRSFLTDPVAAESELAVTIEPAGGSDQPTTVPLIVEPL